MTEIDKEPVNGGEAWLNLLGAEVGRHIGSLTKDPGIKWRWCGVCKTLSNVTLCFYTASASPTSQNLGLQTLVYPGLHELEMSGHSGL
jgi:hypothetical protein